MEPRVCPECGSKNGPSEPRCLNCNLEFPSKPEVGLVSGPSSILGQAAAPAPQQPAAYAPPPPPPPPTDSFAPPPPPTRGAGGFGAMNPPPSMASPMQSARYERPPAEEGVNWRVVALVVLVLTCSTFAAWWFFLRPPSPADTIGRLISAVEAGDDDAAKQCFTSASLVLLGVPSGNTGMAGGFMSARARLDIKVVATSYEGADNETAVVECEPTDGANLPPGITIRFQLVLTQEEGDWRIDVGKTLERARMQTSVPIRPKSG